jgi:KDO2-lipid IV(A) lauroyltransferase
MYYLVYSLLYLVSLIPMGILYVFSDVLFLLLYYLFGYRRGVVMDNLAIAFPEKTEQERRRIARSFYRNLVDNFMETLKLISASEKFIKRHFIVKTPEVIDQVWHSGRKCQVHMGHTFNWELANIGMPYFTSYLFLVVYMPLSNKVFDRLFLNIRKKTGSSLLPATQMNRSLMPYRNMQYMLTLVADQAPGSPEGSYWLKFFNRPTAFLRAPERGARIGDIPVLFGTITKTRRGHYQAELELGVEHPAQLEEGELTRKYVQFMERSITKHPDLYLWSHRRWKHSWQPAYKKMWVGEKDDLPLSTLEDQ